MFNRQMFLRLSLATSVLVAAACADPGVSQVGPTGIALGAGGLAVVGGEGPESANVMNQGGGGVYAPDGATLVRQPNGFRASVTVPTPESGTYNYPAGRVPGHPEVFTLWAFVFNYPNLCTAPCNMDDLGNTPAKGGVYNVGGHVASGASLTISGQIAVGETPFGGWPLESPATAEVHLAIAPHGYVAPENRATEFNLPTGPMAFWWVAVFVP